MPSRNIVRGATIQGHANAKNVPIYVDSDDNILKMIPAGSGSTEVQIVDASSVQTLTNKIDSNWKTLVASETYDADATPGLITGWSWTVAAGGTYIFDAEMATTMTTSGGLTIAFVLTTATLTSIRYNTYAATASDNSTAVSTTGTTATSGTEPFDSKTAAYTHVRVYGSFVVNAGGTFALHGCQETSAAGGDATLILLGSTAKLTRVS